MRGTTSSLDVLQTVLPESLDLRSVMKAPDITREFKIWRPENQQGYTTKGDNRIRFKIPNNEIMDLRRSSLEMIVTLEKTGGTYIRLAQGCPIIDRARIVIGKFESENQFYNRCMNYQWNTGVDAAVQSSVGQDKMGYGSQIDRNAFGADASGTKYTIIMKAGLLNMDILPMKILSKMGGYGKEAFIELTLAVPSQCIETDGTNPEITVSGLEWNYNQLSGAAWESRLENIVRQPGFCFGYREWSCYQNSVTSTSNDLQIPWRGSSINSIHSILVDGSALNDSTKNDRYTTWLKTLSNGSSVTQYQYNFNNTWVPQEAISCRDDADRAYDIYLADQGLWDNRMHMKFAAPIDVTSFNDDQFTMIVDLQSVPRDVWNIRSQDSIFNNLSTVNNTMNTMLRLDLSNPPPANTTCYTFISHNITLRVRSDGELERIW